jgi:hypothetical protein
MKKGRFFDRGCGLLLLEFAAFWLATSLALSLLFTLREADAYHPPPPYRAPNQPALAEHAGEVLLLGLILSPFVWLAVRVLAKKLKDRQVGAFVVLGLLISVPITVLNGWLVNARIHRFGSINPAEAWLVTLVGIAIAAAACFAGWVLCQAAIRGTATRIRILSITAIWLMLNASGEICFRALPKSDINEFVSGYVQVSAPFEHHSEAVFAGGGDYSVLLIVNASQVAVLALPLMVFSIPRWRRFTLRYRR